MQDEHRKHTAHTHDWHLDHQKNRVVLTRSIKKVYYKQILIIDYHRLEYMGISIENPLVITKKES
jgi:hypothetical protein